jgi:hypothetical protein
VRGRRAVECKRAAPAAVRAAAEVRGASQEAAGRRPQKGWRPSALSGKSIRREARRRPPGSRVLPKFPPWLRSGARHVTHTSRPSPRAYRRRRLRGGARGIQLLRSGSRAPMWEARRLHGSTPGSRDGGARRARCGSDSCFRAGKLVSEWPKIFSLFPAMSPRHASR